MIMIGADMNNAELQMKIEKIKDELSEVKYKADVLEKQVQYFNMLTDEIRTDLAKLRELLVDG
jgi:CII-binding regulator of phage lambda lysogenization HflD